MTQKIDCPSCHGEGYLEENVAGGHFDTRAEQWYPLEQQRECPLCRGKCTIDKPTHDNLFNITSDYQQLKSKREFRRSTRNDVVLGILGSKAA
jgi:predicted  nucleic acid-binding Zn ribbon protein